MMRGEIGDPFRKEGVVDKMTTVTVEIDVRAAAAKECLDLLLSTAHEFGLRPSEPPF